MGLSPEDLERLRIMREMVGFPPGTGHPSQPLSGGAGDRDMNAPQKVPMGTGGVTHVPAPLPQPQQQQPTDFSGLAQAAGAIGGALAGGGGGGGWFANMNPTPIGAEEGRQGLQNFQISQWEQEKREIDALQLPPSSGAPPLEDANSLYKTETPSERGAAEALAQNQREQSSMPRDLVYGPDGLGTPRRMTPTPTQTVAPVGGGGGGGSTFIGSNSGGYSPYARKAGNYNDPSQEEDPGWWKGKALPWLQENKPYLQKILLAGGEGLSRGASFAGGNADAFTGYGRDVAGYNQMYRRQSGEQEMQQMLGEMNLDDLTPRERMRLVMASTTGNPSWLPDEENNNISSVRSNFQETVDGRDRYTQQAVNRQGQLVGEPYDRFAKPSRPLNEPSSRLGSWREQRTTEGSPHPYYKNESGAWMQRGEFPTIKGGKTTGSERADKRLPRNMTSIAGTQTGFFEWSRGPDMEPIRIPVERGGYHPIDPLTGNINYGQESFTGSNDWTIKDVPQWAERYFSKGMPHDVEQYPVQLLQQSGKGKQPPGEEQPPGVVAALVDAADDLAGSYDQDTPFHIQWHHKVMDEKNERINKDGTVSTVVSVVVSDTDGNAYILPSYDPVLVGLSNPEGKIRNPLDYFQDEIANGEVTEYPSVKAALKAEKEARKQWITPMVRKGGAKENREESLLDSLAEY